jgi:uncharacterized membrane protein affecting hemolysin expression
VAQVAAVLMVSVLRVEVQPLQAAQALLTFRQITRAVVAAVGLAVLLVVLVAQAVVVQEGTEVRHQRQTVVLVPIISEAVVAVLAAQLWAIALAVRAAMALW